MVNGTCPVYRTKIILDDSVQVWKGQQEQEYVGRVCARRVEAGSRINLGRIRTRTAVLLLYERNSM